MRIQLPLHRELSICSRASAVAHEELPEDIELEIERLCAELPAPMGYLPYPQAYRK